MLTRQTQLFLPTLREAPADAEAISHQLLVRAGLIRQVGAGIWTYLPAGWRVHQKVVAVIREEMDRIGCQEVEMPVVHPADLWRRTGRYDTIGPEMARFEVAIAVQAVEDRHVAPGRHEVPVQVAIAIGLRDEFAKPLGPRGGNGHAVGC